ncbi:DUF927 domain-containing protein [Qingshengfaniella alkalisoli]|nr:DUF927 domain-containing protein [Qingshengfaniella alkalisoli]
MTKPSDSTSHQSASSAGLTHCCHQVPELLPDDGDPAASRVSVGRSEDCEDDTRLRLTTDTRRDDPCQQNRLAEFFAELERGLPDDYVLDEASRGIYFGNAEEPTCSPVRLVSRARSADRTGWMLEVEFLTPDDGLARATISYSELSGQAGGSVSQLIDRGFVAYGGMKKVMTLLRAWPEAGRAWRADHPGWFTDPDGVMAFVTADGAIYRHQSRQPAIVLSDPQPVGFGISGSLAGWQAEVAARAVGNPLLVFAIATALAGPLLHLSAINSAGFNFYGLSGIGKSLLLRLAISCGTNPARLESWTSAQSGLHRFSRAAQDGLLALDAFPRDPEARHLRALLAIGEDLGAGRVLSSRDPDGGFRWRRMMLSTSELPLAYCLRRKNKDVPHALAARIIEIPADPGPYGLLHDLHGYESGTRFARDLDAAMERHHGTLLRAFLDRLTRGLPAIRSALSSDLHRIARDIQAQPEQAGSEQTGLPTAVAERCALVAYAGELAISFGLLPWSKGTADEAVRAVASLGWQAACSSSINANTPLDILRDYLDQNATRIVDLPPEQLIETPQSTIGWQDEEHVYLLGDPLRRDVAELDHLLDQLQATEILKPGGEARSLQYKLPASKIRSRPRSYRLDRSKLMDTERSG